MDRFRVRFHVPYWLLYQFDIVAILRYFCIKKEGGDRGECEKEQVGDNFVPRQVARGADAAMSPSWGPIIASSAVQMTIDPPQHLISYRDSRTMISPQSQRLTISTRFHHVADFQS